MTAERPATGATDADIEAAAKRRAIHEGELNVDEEQMEWYRKIYRGHAAILVPPGTVIALAEHVVTDELRDAMRKAADLLFHTSWDVLTQYGLEPSDLNLLLDAGRQAVVIKEA